MQEFQRDLTGFMRMLLEKAPMTADILLQLTGSVSESPEFGDEFKRSLLLAANIALSEKEQRAGANPKPEIRNSNLEIRSKSE